MILIQAARRSRKGAVSKALFERSGPRRDVVRPAEARGRRRPDGSPIPRRLRRARNGLPRRKDPGRCLGRGLGRGHRRVAFALGRVVVDGRAPFLVRSAECLAGLGGEVTTAAGRRLSQRRWGPRPWANERRARPSTARSETTRELPTRRFFARRASGGVQAVGVALAQARGQGPAPPQEAGGFANAGRVLKFESSRSSAGLFGRRRKVHRRGEVSFQLCAR